MSTEIEQRVVEMQFDNKQFEQNVSTTMSSLGKLKDSLNLTGATKGLEGVDAAARGINLSGLTGAAETVSLKFSAMYSAVDQIFRNLVSRAQFTGERIMSALTIEPIKMGYQEYETQMNAVQTILANTESKGTTITDVNKALDALNTYADKTIYNFTEMTRNIGTFTAAGVDLDTSVNAIQGIANLAAISGSNSQQASTAMYQLSQALSSGTLKLQDWNSVVNAGMGGQVFQEALKETARVHGVNIDAMIEKHGSFRETLSEGWITSEILTETLSHFTMAAEKGSEQWNEYKNALKEQGYTDEQAEEILNLSNTATDAATKVKTFTQLIDTLKESLQSGWTQTWEILVGDFEEAKELFTKVSDTIGAMIGDSAQARNDLLQGWKDAGGRDDLIAGLTNIFTGLMNVIKPVKDAFQEIFPPITVDRLLSISEGFRKLTEKFILLPEVFAPVKAGFDTLVGGTDEVAEHNAKVTDTIDKITRAFKGLFAFADIVIDAIGSLVGGLFDLLGLAVPLGGGLLSVAAAIGDWLVNFRDASKETDVFGNAIDKVVGFVEKIVEKIKALGNSVRLAFQTPIMQKFADIFGTAVNKVSSFISKVVGKIKEFGSSIGSALRPPTMSQLVDIFSTIWDIILKIGSKLSQIFAPLGKAILDLFGATNLADVMVDGMFASLLVNLHKLVGNMDGVMTAISGGFTGMFASIGKLFADLSGEGGIKATLDSIRGCLEAYQTNLKSETIKNIAIAIAILAASIFVISSIDAASLAASLTAISILFAELVTSLKTFTKLDFKGNLAKGVTAIVGIASALLVLAIAMKIMSTMSWGEIAVGLVGTVAGLTALVAAVNFLPKENVTKAAKAIGKLATALVVLAVGMKIMASMSGNELAIALTGVAGGLTALVVAVNLLPTNNVGKSASAITKLSVAMVILAAGMKIMASMNGNELAIALTGVAGGLTALVAAVNLLPKDAALRSLGMIGFATAIVILGAAMKIMASMNGEELSISLLGLIVGLAALVTAINLLPKDTALRSLGMIGLAAAMIILGDALKSMGSMSWEEVARGLTAMGGALAILVIALNLMNGTLAGSAALIIAAIALSSIGNVMTSLGDMSWESIGKGLVALAGAFAVIGLAGLLLTSVVPTILALAASLLVLSLATIGVGAGLILIGGGIAAVQTALSIGVASIIAGLTAIIMGIVDLIPAILSRLGNTIIVLCDAIRTAIPAIVETLFALFSEILSTFSEHVPVIVNAIFVLISEIFDNLATYVPVIVNALFELLIGVINVLAERLPELIVAFVNLLGSLFQGVVDALSTVGVSSLIEGIAGVGVLAALMGMLAAVAGLIPGAMVGVLGMGVVIAELALVLAAIGALAQIPGLSWLIGEGGDFLQQIGTAIGQFVGGIIGGIAEGATSTLPQVGSNLSGFMTNLQPFIDGMQSLDASILDNAQSLASTILMLTAADLLSGITSFLSGGQSIADFGTEISAFGTAMKDYSNEVAGIDTAAVETSVEAAKGLFEIANNIPSDGLFGTDGIDDFGDNIVDFGKRIKEYADEVAGVDTDAITASATAAKALVDVAGQLPDDGSLGSDGIDDFGSNISSFGNSLKKYSDKIADVSISSITSSVSVVKSLVSAIDNMTGMDSSGVDSFVDAVNDLSGVNFNGFVETFTKSTADLTAAGKNMFNAVITGMKSTSVNFVTTARGIVDVGINAIKDGGSRFKIAGIETINKFTNAILNGKSRLLSAFASVLTSTLSKIDGYKDDFYSAGAYLVIGFANGINENRYRATAQARAMAAAAAEAAREELDEHSPSRVGYEIGDFFGLGFVNAIGDNTRRAYAASADMANSAKTGLKGAFDKVLGIINGEIDVSPTISPVLDLTNVRSGADAINGMFGLRPSVGVLASVGAVSSMMNQRGQNRDSDEIVSAINRLYDVLENAGGTTNIIDGVTYDDGSNIADAVRTITRVARMGRRV